MSPTQTVLSNDKGEYSFSGLRAGIYQVNFSLVGFQNVQSQKITIIAGQVIQQDGVLQPVGNTTVANVVESAPQVELSEPSVYNTLSSREIENLQLNGRNFIQLIALTPGVINQTGQDEAAVGVKGSAAFSVNGGRTEYNTFSLDGADLLNVGFNGGVNTLMVYPSLDAIGDMKILTSNFGAMYGRSASGTVLVNTKPGTEDFHGNLYGFVRNEAFNARNFFDETKGAPLYRRLDFGGTIGGPIYIPGVYNKNKNKSFFFFSEEYRKEKSPEQFNQGVPTAAERSGNFSDVCPSQNQLYRGQVFFKQAAPPGQPVFPDCPFDNQAPVTLSGSDPNLNKYPYYTPFPNNNLLAAGSYFASPVASAILSTGVLPLPNATSGCNSSINSCFDTTVSLPTHWHEELFRIDHYLNDNSRLMVRYVHDAWDTVTSTPQYGYVTSNFPTIYNNFNGPGENVVVRLTQTLSPTLVNEPFFTFGNSKITLADANGLNATFSRPASLDAPCSTAANGQAICGMGYLFNNGFGGKLPGLQFIGGSAYGNGFAVDPSYMPWSHTNPTYTFGDSVSKQFGQHFFQAGVEFTFFNRTQTNSVSGSATGDTQGLLTYNARELGTGNVFADFLLERVLTHPSGGEALVQSGAEAAGFQQDSGQLTYKQRYSIAEPYIQDDWKVTPRFTLNLGLRLSLFGLYHELNDNVYNWEASAYNPVLASQIQIAPADSFGAGAVETTGPNPSILTIGSNGSVPPQLLNGVVRCGYNGVPSGCMQGHVVNPAPRIGFAWDPRGNGKTSIRAGYGIFFEHGTGNESNTGALEGSAPGVLDTITTDIPDLSCIGPANAFACSGGTVANGSGQSFAYPLNVTSIPTKVNWPYVQQWSFSVQRELPLNTIATFAYVGSKGTHLTALTQANSLPEVPASGNPFGPNQPLQEKLSTTGGNTAYSGDCGITAAGFVLSSGQIITPSSPAYTNLSVACSYSNPATASALINADRPYVGIGQIVSLTNNANSAYRALQITLKHSSGPVTAGVSYTFSDSHDDSSDRFDPIPNAYDLKTNWAPSSFDQRHAVSVSYVWDLPSPVKSGWLKLPVNGWQLSGITVYQSGTPFSVISASTLGASTGDNAGVANGVGNFSLQSYPDVVGNLHAAPPPGANNGTTFGPELYNPSAFVAPRGLTFGNAGRDSLRNPNRLNFDLSLFKNFKMKERYDCQFRAEAFNVGNTTQFELFNPAKGNQPNNEITCYGGSNYSAGDASCLAGNAFLHPVDAHRPRTLQLALKLSF